MITTTCKFSFAVATVVACVTAPLVIQHFAQVRLREISETLRRQADQLARLAAENERLSNPLSQPKSPQLLSDDQLRELLSRNNSVAKAVTVWEPLMGYDKLIYSHTGSGSPNSDRLH